MLLFSWRKARDLYTGGSYVFLSGLSLMLWVELLEPERRMVLDPLGYLLADLGAALLPILFKGGGSSGSEF